MSESQTNARDNVGLCVSLCEVSPLSASADELESMLSNTCYQAGFPHCERVYVGSYFCENFFLGLTDAFHESVYELCQRHDLGATLVIPIIGQAFLERAWQRIPDVIARFANVYDEVVVNDVAMFYDLQRWFAGEGLPAIGLTYEASRVSSGDESNPKKATNTSTIDVWQALPVPRLGLGRLFSKGLRDARYPEMRDRMSLPELSAEAGTCLSLQARCSHGSPMPLIEIDPTSAVVDVSKLIEDIEGNIGPAYDPSTTDIAIHLPYCYATTGRNCGPASVDEPDFEKFRLGKGCSHHCLRMSQGYFTDEDIRYFKHGRTYYFENPACQIAGTDSWRIVYAASLQ